MSDNFQVPLFLRQYVSAISAVPSKGANAYTITSRIVFFDLVSFDTVVHESTHAQDWGFNNNTYGSQAWDEAIAEDSCVADVYAQNNNVEAYAQAMVTFLYKLLLPQDATVSGNATDCMSHQLEFINNSQAPGLQDFIKVQSCRVSCCMKENTTPFSLFFPVAKYITRLLTVACTRAGSLSCADTGLCVWDCSALPTTPSCSEIDQLLHVAYFLCAIWQCMHVAKRLFAGKTASLPSALPEMSALLNCRRFTCITLFCSVCKGWYCP